MEPGTIAPSAPPVQAPSPSVDEVSDFVRSFSPDPALGNGPVEALLRCYSADGRALIHAAEAGTSEAGSGGYVEFLARYLQRCSRPKTLAGGVENDTNTENTLEFHAGRNQDISETHLTILTDLSASSSSSSVIKFGRVYGFRNIQSMLLKLKRQKLDLDFVEVMACPSGCVNGGGQIKTAERETSSAMKERVARVDALYHSRHCVSIDDSSLLKYLYGTRLPHHEVSLVPPSLDLEVSQSGLEEASRSANGSGLSRSWADQLFHTRFHAVPKLEALAPLTAKW